MNILFTSVAISQLKCLDYAFFVAKMSKMTFTRFGGQVWLNGGQVRQFWGREQVKGVKVRAGLKFHVYSSPIHKEITKTKSLNTRLQTLTIL